MAMGTKMAEWGDWSGPSPSVEALRAAGITGALRYIGDGSEGKQIHRAEANSYAQKSFPYKLVTELRTTDAWEAGDDYASGVARAQRAVADAKAEGIPDSVGIAWAADAHATPDQVRQALDYGRGFQSVTGNRTGVYGFIEILRAARAAGLGTWFWLAGSKPSLADQQWINFWQRNDMTRTVSGTVIDINVTYANLGDFDMQWNDVVTVTTADGKYSETHTVGELFSSAWFKGNDTYNALWGVIDAPPTLKKITDRLDALGISGVTSGGSTPTDVATKADLLQLRQDLQPLFDLAARLKD
jgi:hypothetical protein